MYVRNEGGAGGFMLVEKMKKRQKVHPQHCGHGTEFPQQLLRARRALAGVRAYVEGSPTVVKELRW